MTPLIALAILITTLITAFISGIFGMAGGIILMGVLAILLPVSHAMVIHGAIQLVSNGWRAFLLRDHVDYKFLKAYVIGAGVAFAVLMFIVWRPDKQALFLLLGALPLLVWLPRNWVRLDALSPRQGAVSGFVISGLNTLAGVSGPLLDLLFINTPMTRQQIVASKSASQVIAHVIKIVVWSYPSLVAAGWSTMPPMWIGLAAIPLSMCGTWAGSQVLHRLTDVSFRKWMKWLVTGVGITYLARGFGLY